MERLDHWDPATTPIPLGDDDVHLWKAHIARSQDAVERLWQVLESDEKERAERFRFERDRNAFVVSRGLLRTLTAEYLSCGVEAIDLVQGPYGKPQLAGPVSDLRFNVSHSGDLSVLAFASGAEIGVDVEKTTRDIPFLDIGRRFFARSEMDVMERLPSARIRDAFYACWTRKEAYIKALGLGVTHGLSNFAVSVHPDDAPSLLASDLDPAAPERWEIADFYPDRGYRGALAIQGKGRAVRLFEWRPVGFPGY